ncbi:MAG: glycosyltransferase family 2 protein [Flavobacteriaceae bacterium]
MLVCIHEHNKVVAIFDHESQASIPIESTDILKSLFLISRNFSNRIIIWAEKSIEEYIAYDYIKASFNIKNKMISYGEVFYVSDRIGYVEDSPFLKVSKSVCYPTWLMSGTIGAIHASELLKYKDIIKSNEFDYALNSIAKLGMPKGLFCYSNPKLLNNEKIKCPQEKISTLSLFKFVKQHYKWVWVWILFLNFILHERKVNLVAILYTLFFKKINTNFKHHLKAVETFSIDKLPSIDVILPTIGREECLYDVLKDLALQTHLPEKVIIIEQNPEINSSSKLAYLKTEKWPFKICHNFTHQTGACNARNMALKLVTSEFVFLGDDDNRFGETLIENALKFMLEYNVNVFTTTYLQEHEKQVSKDFIQWPTFGAGNSFMKTSLIKKVSFDLGFEFGYGEDADYGAQLRNIGEDIIYNPLINILHLKAPIGGFRTKMKQKWDGEKILPKPSPTVLLNYLKNRTDFQVLGYKTILFLKFYTKQPIKNPFKYRQMMRKRWNKSVYYANQLL